MPDGGTLMRISYLSDAILTLYDLKRWEGFYWQRGAKCVENMAQALL